MSRSGYDDDDDTGYLDLYRANVDRALAGKRGQAFLKEMLAAMDMLPEKRLIDGLMEAGGEVCAIGSVGKARGIDMDRLNALAEDEDPDLARFVANKFGIALCMAAEIMYMNDEAYGRRVDETPEQRFERMRKWVENQIRKDAPA